MNDKFLIKKTKVRVIGVGGGGGSVISELARKIKGVSFFAMNTDSQALKKVPGKVHRFQIGKELTRGLGTGMDPELGKVVAEEERKRIERVLEKPDFRIFIACLGGGTGSGVTPVLAKASSKFNGINLGIFTLPFDFEGEKRKKIARDSLEEITPYLNGFLVIHNQNIFQVIKKETSLDDAFTSLNKILARNLGSLVELIYKPGLINIDFADFKTILKGRGREIYFNTAKAKGPDRAGIVTEKVLSSSLVDFDVKTGSRFLFNISTSSNLKMREVEQICSTFSSLNKKSKIIFGISSESISKESEIKVTLLIVGRRTKDEPEIKISEGEVRKNRKKKGVRKTKKRSKERKKGKGKDKEKVKKVKKVKEKPRVRVKQEKKKDKSVEVSKIDGKNSTETDQKKSEGIPVEIRTGKKRRKKKRLNALEVRKVAQKEESDRLAMEEKWDIPTFLRKSPWREKIKIFARDGKKDKKRDKNNNK